MKSLALALMLLGLGAGSVSAAEKGGAPVGYGGKKVQMNPIMAPYRTSVGTHYEVLTIRVTFDTGAKERFACFAIPIVHDRFIRYLYDAKLTSEDFVGERRDVLAHKLFDVAVDAIGRGYYSALEIVDPSKEDLNPKTTAATKSREESEAISEGKKKPKGGGKPKGQPGPGEVDPTLSSQCTGK